MEIIKKIIVEEDGGMRLDRWFKKNNIGYSFHELAKLARTGQIRLDGKRIKGSERVSAGQEVRFPKCNKEPIKKSQNQNYSKKQYDELVDEITSRIIYIDSHILVLNKPAGLAVQGGNGVEISIDYIAKDLLFDLKEKPRLVHRIDRDTSGILVMARSIKASQELMHIFKNHRVEKNYLALTQKIPLKKQGTIDLPLEKKYSGPGFESMVVSDNGKDAITNYKILAHTEGLGVWDVAPITGRKHQIRAHLSSIGCPIIGDRKYGGSLSLSNKILQSNYLYLHAHKIKFQLFGETLKLSAPLPHEFMEAMDAFKLILKEKI